MRPIDADTLLDDVRKHTSSYIEDFVKKLVDEQPSIQPEIIRCKDCKHRDPEDKKCDCGHDIIWQMPRNDKWYCADGERKDD